MNAVNASAGEDAMRGLMETAFTAGEPALPDVDDVMATVEVLGGHMRHRQRVRTGLAAGVLCVAGFGMVAGIGAVAHSNHSGGSSVVGPGGSGGPAAPPVTDTGTTQSGGAQSSGTSGGTVAVP
ncbi:hypothetical protein ABH935_009337 [Catenulispora sp. GAS73]|uniref:hypothetical protein n=1 Tax=Catenulispora sp. GAS73 TaxID=3156269 RepID=UPI0035169F55